MSVRVVCPACRAAYPVGDGYRGKRVRCAKCQEPFWVDDAEADPDEEVVTANLVQAATPRGSRRADDDFRDEVDTENRFIRRPAGHRHRVLLIVGAAVLVVLLALLAATWRQLAPGTVAVRLLIIGGLAVIAVLKTIWQ